MKISSAEFVKNRLINGLNIGTMLLCIVFCSFAFCCLGQKTTILKLPRTGIYKKSLLLYGETIKITRSYIEDYLHEDTLRIREDAFFVGSIFQNEVRFDGIDFKKKVSFYQSTLQQTALFNNSIFHNKTEFYECDFQNTAIFEGVDFKNQVNFLSTNFQNGAIFYNTNFNYLAVFNGSEGSGDLGFTDAQMPNILNFQEVRTLKADFRNVLIDSLQKRKLLVSRYIPLSMFAIVFDSPYSESEVTIFALSQKLNKCVIKLKGTNLSNIVLPYDRFWADTTGYAYEEKTALYEKLIKVCKDEGMDESLDGWSIELKKIQNLRNFPRIGHYLNWFQNTFWGYGFSKWYILLWIIGVFLLFLSLNFLIYPQLLRVYFNPKLGTNLFPVVPTSVDALISSLKTSYSVRFRYILHFTGVLFFGLKLEHSDISFKHLRWVFILYFQFVTGIVLLGFALNFILSK